MRASDLVIGVIPARGGSKGIPKKNLALLGGKPLIDYTIDAARESQQLAEFFVSTDSADIAEHCKKKGAWVPALRPLELATDSARIQDAVRYALCSWLEAKAYKYVMLLQPTAPFRTSQDIDEVILLAKKYDADSVVSFSIEETKHPYYMYYVDPCDDTAGINKLSPVVSYKVGTPRQEFPRCVYRNGAIYLVKLDVFLEQDVFITSSVVPYLMPPERSLNIDTPEDLRYADHLIQTR